MKGIILAGGRGTRLYPATLVTSKQLLAVYDKPMIFYPLATLLGAGINDILLISTPSDLDNFRHLLGDGSNLGITLSYLEQPTPDGLAQAFILGEDFIGTDSCAMILGDNIFYGDELAGLLQNAANVTVGATIIGANIDHPERFGVIGFDPQGNPISIEEKPTHPASSCAVTGLYFYDNRCVQFAKSLTPSARGELEISDLNRLYLVTGELTVEILSPGTTWMDAGTPESLTDASNFVRQTEGSSSTKIGAIEEVAFKMGYIDRQALRKLAKGYGDSPYGHYLEEVCNENL